MSEEYAGLSGEIENWPSKDEMCQILEAANLSLNVGEYAIRIQGFDHFVFREFGGDLGAPCITADEESAEELIRQSSIVSKALTVAGLRHRFEVYDGNDELVAYHHHNWPKDW
ncbi:hypothetical protein GCM10007421_38200 [Halopseudomonas oceani]|uniref:hypothetical protein n=1 Tax=Halopseudomonas oceani TaxID=1708783 RepID=UPI0011AF825E|nr:hypothetical protein [Halopseudomonas oceani]GGE59878.1 hypothetical protein GCM10007421_38200 [Halopseudomonas oceani]